MSEKLIFSNELKPYLAQEELIPKLGLKSFVYGRILFSCECFFSKMNNEHA